MQRLLIGSALAALGQSAAAHEGHGPTGLHWHATDLWGFVALGAVAALVWYQRRK